MLVTQINLNAWNETARAVAVNERLHVAFIRIGELCNKMVHDGDIKTRSKLYRTALSIGKEVLIKSSDIYLGVNDDRSGLKKFVGDAENYSMLKKQLKMFLHEVIYRRTDVFGVLEVNA